MDLASLVASCSNAPHLYCIGGVSFGFFVDTPLIVRGIDDFLSGHKAQSGEKSSDFQLVYSDHAGHKQLINEIESGALVHSSHLYPDVTFELREQADGTLGMITAGEHCALFDPHSGNAVFSAPDIPPAHRFLNISNTLLVPMLNEMLALHRMYLMHCACVAVNGRGVLIGAESGGGKTTMTLALSLSGADFISDDITLLDMNREFPLFRGFSRSIRILPDTLNIIPGLSHLKGRDQVSGKIEIEPSDLAPKGIMSQAAASLLLFPHQDQDDKGTDFEKLTPGDALQYLVPHGMFVSGVYNYHLRMIALLDLLEHTPAYRLRTRLPAAAIPEIIKTLLADEYP